MATSACQAPSLPCSHGAGTTRPAPVTMARMTTPADHAADPHVREALRRELPGLEEAVPLASFTAYGVGGPAEFLVRAGTTGVLIHAVLTARELGLPVTVLGRCTNVLVGDAGVRGLTVLARNEGTTLHGNVLRAEAGVELPALVADLAGQGLDGLTFAANIPGSVGRRRRRQRRRLRRVGERLPARRPPARRGQGARRRARPPGLRLPELAAQVAAGHRRPLRLVPAAPRPPPRAAASASPRTRRCARASTRSSTPAAAATSRIPRASCRRPA